MLEAYTKETPAKGYWVQAYCDHCKTKLRFTGEVKTTHPPLYVHVCDKCNQRGTMNECYPYIRYE